jgi:hypothetical protein
LELLEPWIVLRLALGLVAVGTLVMAATTAALVLRRFDVMRATEGQLALERRVKLASTLVRVGAIAQVAALVSSVLSADKLSRGIRGAMCAYGTFNSSPWGFRALATTAIAAVLAGTVAELFALDARFPRMDLTRPLAVATLVLAPVAVVDLGMQIAFYSDLDLSAVASCCSVQLDAGSSRALVQGGAHVRLGVASALLVAMIVALALVAAVKPRRGLAVAAGVLSLAALPLAAFAVAFDVAPYVFEAPAHQCPFCLLQREALGLGYPLFGALFVGAVSLFGVGLSALLARAPSVREVWSAFAKSRLRLAAIAWGSFAVLATLPIVRYALVTHGGSLWP